MHDMLRAYACTHICTCNIHTHTILTQRIVSFCFIVGNKNDSPDKKVVELAEAQKYADQVGIDLFETSAKDNINVEEVCTCNKLVAGSNSVLVIRVEICIDILLNHAGVWRSLASTSRFLVAFVWEVGVCMCTSAPLT